MGNKKRRRLGLDPILLGIILLLTFFGILILASVSASFSLLTFGNTYYFFNHQILLGLLPGFLAAAFIILFVPAGLIKRLSLPAILFTLVLLVAVFLPVIGSTEGANRWIFVGPLSFQPSELLKLTFILYVAALLSNQMAKKKESGKRAWQFLLKGKEALIPFMLITGVVSFLLLAQPDLSTLGVIALTGVFMYFAAATPLWHTPLLIVGGGAAAFLLIKLAPYRFSRLAVFLDPSLDPLGQGYQIKQALIGIGSGGLTGVGLGLSFQKYGFLPEPISDSIFAIIAEELGFLGAVFLILLFLAFAWRSFILARNIQDPFSKIAVIGIASWITIQAFVNMAAITGIMPLTGIPLPFVSYGGSALAVELVAMGILLKLTAEQKSSTMRTS